MTGDLRGFLEANEDLVLRVPEPVPLDRVSALINQADRPVLFERLDGHPGWRICDLLFRDREAQSRVLRTSPERVLPELADRLRRPPVDPMVVSDAPVRERVVTGDDVDLTGLPAFTHGDHPDEPAVVIAMTVCRDPETGNTNLGFTRMTPLSADTATFFIGSSPHMRSVLSTYEDRGEPMPFAFVVGTHPAYEVLASYSVPTHLERFGELDLVGNLLDGPAELVPAETVDLEVPASAEVVIEGVVRPGDRVDEGPGPSQWLYYYPGVSRQPVFEATAVLRRENPVFRQVDTIVFSDHQPLLTLPAEALLFEELRENGHDVLDVRYVPWGGTVCCVLQVTPRHASRVREAMLLAMGTRWPNAKLVIAVDDDVDIGDPRELLWSISTRVDPERDVFTVPAAAGHPADPSARDIEGAPGTAEVGRLGIDACKPGTARPASRDRFRRARPMGMDDVDLEDYL